MNKILITLVALIIALPSFAKTQKLEEVNLELPQASGVEEIGSEDDVQVGSATTSEKTLREKLNDVYHLEIEQIDKPSYLFKDILTKHFDEESAWDSMQLWGAYNADEGLYFKESGATYNHYEFNTINAGLDGKLKNNNGDFRIMFNYAPLSSRNVVQNLFADMYIATNKIPHHRVLIGHSRPPVGMEGGYSPYTLPFAARSQISRTFGTVRKLGARVTGDYSFVDYDLGVYSSDTYFQEFFPGAEFIGWVNLKPLAKTDGRYGKLKIGGGLQGGHRDNNYCVTGAYVGWEYKKLLLNFEWAEANGYNGTSGSSSDKHASGFYTTIAYRITPKVQALLRYDEFDPDHNIAHNNRREYTAGVNYFIKGQALKVFLNYVFCQNDAAKDSHRILLGTQILI
jgi:hypothetical protein